MPETDKLHPLAMENTELRERLAQTEALASRVIEERDHHREKLIQAERERAEARGLLRRAEYQLVHTTPELDFTLSTEIVVHLGRGD